MTADLLIGCDGINSTTRSLLYPDEGLARFSGRLLWRGCLEREPYLSGASMVWAGHANQSSSHIQSPPDLSEEIAQW